MDSFEWDACFVTGLDIVDTQHRHLVDLINRFGALQMQAHGVEAQDMERLLAELANYADYHFREEEALMASFSLDARHTAYHQKQHKQFLQDVTAMRSLQLSSNLREEGQALLGYLTNWLAYHILGSDLRMAELVTAAKAGVPPDVAFATQKLHNDPVTATLLQAMTRLFDQISERSRALHELNQTLEARVAERTRELAQSNAKLESMAMTDALTGLPNRRHAMQVLEREWEHASASGQALACMMLDADGFKTINDSHGHDAGDAVLRQLARCLSEAVRNDDIVCRLGGDEFLIICTRTPLDGALHLAEKIRRQVAELHVHAGNGIWHGSISVGVAVRTPDMAHVDALLKAADLGVYAAKHKGRNAVATVQEMAQDHVAI